MPASGWSSRGATVSIKGQIVASLGPGDHFGEIALLDDGPRSATVTAATDLRCNGIVAWEFGPFLQEHPEVAFPMLQSLAARLRDAEVRPERAEASRPSPPDDRNRVLAMRIKVLGKSPAWQDAGGACSGYLLEEGDTTLLLECGNGVFAKLREHVDYTDVDAVLVTHLHADHFVDLVPYSYALLLTPRQQPVPVAGHPGTDDGAPAADRPAGIGPVLPQRGRLLGVTG